MLNYTFGPYAAIDRFREKAPSAGKGRHASRRPLCRNVLFYQPNLEKGDDPLADNTKIWRETPEAFMDINHPFGTQTDAIGGEPLFGYYEHGDEWVIRRHAMMLTMADVDFILFDTTNLTMHKENALKVMKIFNEYQQAGWNVPKFAFYTNSEPGKRAQEIYENIYKTEMYPDVWFMPNGKPLLVGRPEFCSDEVKEFLTSA